MTQSVKRLLLAQEAPFADFEVGLEGATSLHDNILPARDLTNRRHRSRTCEALTVTTVEARTRAQEADLDVLDAVQRRVLWLATAIVHHANRVRPNPSGHQGRRPPGLERVDGLAHDRAVVRAPRGARPRLGQAARLAGPARDQLPARPPGPGVPAAPARVRRPAVLPEPHEGPRPRRLLDRLRRDRRHRADLGRAGPPLRRRALRRARAAGARSRCSATPSSTRARCGRRSSTRWCARLGEVLWVVDLNRQSLDRVVPDIAAGRLVGDVRGRRLAHRDRQVRPAPARAVRARRRRGAARAHRRDGQRGVPAPAARRRRAAARAPARRRRRPSRG